MKTQTVNPSLSAREERVAAALRENLRKRKQQAQKRTETNTSTKEQK